jgi:hypothetical protein
MEIEILKQTLREAADTIQQLRNEIAYLKDARSPDVAATVQLIKERMNPVSKKTAGMLEIISKQLRQECAYVLYLEELAVSFTPFNDLPLEKREAYFKRVDAQVESGKPDPGRFTDPYGR